MNTRTQKSSTATSQCSLDAGPSKPYTWDPTQRNSRQSLNSVNARSTILARCTNHQGSLRNCIGAMRTHRPLWAGSLRALGQFLRRPSMNLSVVPPTLHRPPPGSRSEHESHPPWVEPFLFWLFKGTDPSNHHPLRTWPHGPTPALAGRPCDATT